MERLTVKIGHAIIPNETGTAKEPGYLITTQNNNALAYRVVGERYILCEVNASGECVQELIEYSRAALIVASTVMRQMIVEMGPEVFGNMDGILEREASRVSRE